MNSPIRLPRYPTRPRGSDSSEPPNGERKALMWLVEFDEGLGWVSTDDATECPDSFLSTAVGGGDS